MDIKNLNEVTPFITRDGSEIRELLAHRNSAIRKQSLAEARLPSGGSTQEHYHVATEEIYYITDGTGRIRIDGEIRDVRASDAVAILPGQKHKSLPNKLAGVSTHCSRVGLARCAVRAAFSGATVMQAFSRT